MHRRRLTASGRCGWRIRGGGALVKHLASVREGPFASSGALLVRRREVFEESFRIVYCSAATACAASGSFTGSGVVLAQIAPVWLEDDGGPPALPRCCRRGLPTLEATSRPGVAPGSPHPQRGTARYCAAIDHTLITVG